MIQKARLTLQSGTVIDGLLTGADARGVYVQQPDRTPTHFGYGIIRRLELGEQEPMVRIMKRISECSYKPISNMIEPRPYSEAVAWLKARSQLAGFADADGPLYDLVYADSGRLASWSLR